MRKLAGWILFLILTLILLPGSTPAQELTGHRKLVTRAEPAYPILARKLKLYGAVKVEVLVAADGRVKAADLLGGHPVLAKAALDAIRQWKWEAGTHDSHEIVLVNFNP